MGKTIAPFWSRTWAASTAIIGKVKRFIGPPVPRPNPIARRSLAIPQTMKMTAATTPTKVNFLTVHVI